MSTWKQQVGKWTMAPSGLKLSQFVFAALVMSLILLPGRPESQLEGEGWQFTVARTATIVPVMIAIALMVALYRKSRGVNQRGGFPPPTFFDLVSIVTVPYCVGAVTMGVWLAPMPAVWLLRVVQAFLFSVVLLLTFPSYAWELRREVVWIWGSVFWLSLMWTKGFGLTAFGLAVVSTAGILLTVCVLVMARRRIRYVSAHA